jgi:hypothetical protein
LLDVRFLIEPLIVSLNFTKGSYILAIYGVKADLVGDEQEVVQFERSLK